MKDKYRQSVDRFNEFAAEFEHGFMELSLYDKAIESFCSTISIPEPKILELGCGPGNVTRRIKSHLPDAQITAIDMAENMISLARKNVPDVDFKVMDARCIDLLIGPFDAIIAAFVLPFLSYEDCSDLLAKISTLLIPDGKLYLSTMEGTPKQNGFESTSFSGENKIHFTYYGEFFLRNQFEKVGISIINLVKQPYIRNYIPLLTDIIIFGQKSCM
jgi:ubiquinone/menaquinone biosynthesis C-methylase UbiE